ncbi:MAG: hypothetical protein ACLQD8_02955 [Thermoplasmata archaeon]
MTRSPLSPVAGVQVMQALVARELVEQFGLPERQAASLLGIVPSSVSQYLSGKRLGPTLARYLGDEESRRIARHAAQELISSPSGSRPVLEAAIALGELVGSGHSGPRGKQVSEMRPERRREIPRWLHHRIAGEQNAVAECMRLAQHSRDELTRALFRQIASDSLRHAEIVASLGAYLDRGVSSVVPTGITRADVERLIEREHAAEADGEGNLGPDLGGVMRILWDSMEADERKHEQLLEKLLLTGLADDLRGKRRSRTAKVEPSDPRPSSSP